MIISDNYVILLMNKFFPFYFISLLNFIYDNSSLNEFKSS